MAVSSLGSQLNQPLVLVDQAFLVKLDEDLDNRLGQPVIHGEALRDPSRHDAPSRFSWLTIAPPDSSFHSQIFVDEGLARQIAAVDLLFRQLALHHHLRGDAGMIHARLPQDVLAAHALEADEDGPAACC